MRRSCGSAHDFDDLPDPEARWIDAVLTGGVNDLSGLYFDAAGNVAHFYDVALACARDHPQSVRFGDLTYHSADAGFIMRDQIDL